MTSEYESAEYPVTIFYARYSGVYEGGPWAAVNTEPADKVLEGAVGGDIEAWVFFDNARCGELRTTFGERLFVGAGNNPQEALDNLIAKLGK